MTIFERVGIFWSDYGFLVGTGVLILWLFFIRYLIRHFQEFVQRFTHRPASTPVNEALIHTAAAPASFGLFLIGIWMVAEISGLATPVRIWIRQATLLAFLGLATFFIFRFIDELTDVTPHKKDSSLTVMHMGGWIVKGTSLLFLAIVLLEWAGIRTLPMIAILGVGLFLVGLASREILANVLSGYILKMENQIVPGARIRFDNGMEGTVEEVGWQTTRLRSSPGESMMIPNKKLHESSVHILAHAAIAPPEEHAGAAWR